MVPVIPVLLISLAVCVFFVLALMFGFRRRTAGDGPRCGNCGYNLTGSQSNRCPECGKLFIEAGIITKPPPSHSKRAVVIAGLTLVILFATFTSLLIFRLRAARSQAVAVRRFVSTTVRQSATTRAAAVAGTAKHATTRSAVSSEDSASSDPN